MPEDYITEKGTFDRVKQEALLYKRYQDPNQNNEQRHSFSEQEQLENQFIKKSTTRQQEQQQADELMYDYVFDESQHIDFVLDKASSKTKQKLADLPPKISESELKKLSIKEVRESLPVFTYRSEILRFIYILCNSIQFFSAIEQFQVLIIVGETGSGKTTQIPQYLVEAGYCADGKKV